MEILAFIFTIIAGVFFEAVGVKVNLSGLGNMVAVALMGAIILWTIRHKK